MDKENGIRSYLVVGNEDKPDWVHVAIAKGRENEKNTKIAYRENGKTKYKKW